MFAMGCGMAKSSSKKIVKVREWRGTLKRIELECGHWVERAIYDGKPLPKSNRLSCDRCSNPATSAPVEQ